ncbi:hypothetical protein NPIL_209051 [Nephila pilipes]|uniref:USP domain-containing protein n=1 Tax=Nephila pilipes TaxID=299642 RepID=A0A8X6U5N2_NEPPI|nr:hypothetical protein NPIL_209051 [Nephila pilipes]
MSTSNKVKCLDNILSKDLVPKNERLDNVIRKIKNQSHFVDEQNSVGPEIIASTKETDEGSTNLVKNNINWTLTDDKSLNQNYLTWENSSNLCWLDASMSLLVHNKTLCHSVPKDSPTQTAYIIESYKEAISIFNDHSSDDSIEKRLQIAKNLLKSIQESVLKYLKPFLKCSEGKPDSAFCSLLNLIGKDQEIKNFFIVRYAWHLICKKCPYSTIKNYEKPIITFNEVKKFNPHSPISLWKCPKCEAPKQEICLEYKTLPSCLIFHFENGAGNGEFDAEKLDFEINGRKYKLSGLLTLQKGQISSMNHFVTWIRDVITGYWLECDDLNSETSSFTMSQPTINLKDLSIISYEAIDNNGTILLKADTEDATESSNDDYLLIDLADESKDNVINKTGETNDTIKLKESAFEFGKKNCNENDDISTDSIDNKTLKLIPLNDGKELTFFPKENEAIIKKDASLKTDSPLLMDSLCEFLGSENSEMSKNASEDLFKYWKKHIDGEYDSLQDGSACISSNVVAENDIESIATKEIEIDYVPLQDSSTCKSSNVVTENYLEANATKAFEEIFKVNDHNFVWDDIFRTESEKDSIEVNKFPLGIPENLTAESVHKKRDDICLLQNEPDSETTEINLKKSDLFLQRELKLGNEAQQVSENSAREFSTEGIKHFTINSEPIFKIQDPTVSVKNTENSINHKYMYSTRSRGKKMIDNPVLETVLKNNNLSAKPYKSSNHVITSKSSEVSSVSLNRKTTSKKHVTKTAHNSSSKAIKKKKRPIIVDEIMPCAKFVLKEVSVVIEKLKESELSKYISLDCRDVGQKLNCDNIEKEQKAEVCSPVKVPSNSIEELTKTIVVKSKRFPDIKTCRKTKKQQNLLRFQSQQLNNSKVSRNVSVSKKAKGKSAVKNGTENNPEPVRRSSRIHLRKLASKTLTDNVGESVKKYVNDSKLKQNDKPLAVQINNPEIKSTNKIKNKCPKELNEIEHDIKRVELQTETILIEACKSNSGSSHRNALKTDETLKKEIPKNISKLTHSLSNLNLDATFENFKFENVRSELLNKRKRSRLKEVDAYKSPTIMNSDLIASSNRESSCSDINRSKGVKTNTLNRNQTNYVQINELQETTGMSPDYSSLLVDSGKRKKDRSNLMNSKRCRRAKSTDNYSRSETFKANNVSNTVCSELGMLTPYQKKKNKAKESISFSGTSKDINIKNTNSNETSKSNAVPRIASIHSSKENHDGIFSPIRQRRTRSASSCYSGSEVITNTVVSTEAYPQLESIFTSGPSVKSDMEISSYSTKEPTETTRVQLIASPNGNHCKVSSSGRRRKTNISSYCSESETIEKNISNKVYPRRDMLTPFKKKENEAIVTKNLIPKQHKTKLQGHSNNHFVSHKESISFSRTSENVNIKNRNSNQTSKSNAVPKIASTHSSKDNCDGIISPTRQRRSTSSCCSGSEIITNNEVSTKAYHLESISSSGPSVKSDMEISSNKTNESSETTRVQLIASSNGNHRKFSSPRKRRKTSISSYCFESETMVKNISNKVYPRRDMLTPYKKSIKYSTEAECTTSTHLVTNSVGHSHKLFVPSSEHISSTGRSRNSDIEKTNSNQTNKLINTSEIVSTPSSNKIHSQISSSERLIQSTYDIHHDSLNSLPESYSPKTTRISHPTVNSNFIVPSNHILLSNNMNRNKIVKTNVMQIKELPGTSGILPDNFSSLTNSGKRKKEDCSNPVNNDIDRNKSARTNKFNLEPTNVVLFNELPESFGMLPDNLKFLIDSSKEKEEDCSNSVNIKSYINRIKNLGVEINSNQANEFIHTSKTVFTPSLNENRDEISLPKRIIQNTSNIHNKSQKSLPDSSALKNILYTQMTDNLNHEKIEDNEESIAGRDMATTNDNEKTETGEKKKRIYKCNPNCVCSKMESHDIIDSVINLTLGNIFDFFEIVGD